MRKDLDLLIIPDPKADYVVTDRAIYPVSVFPRSDIKKALEKTPNVFIHPDSDINMAFSYPEYFKKSDSLSLDEITTGESLLRSIDCLHFTNHQVEDRDYDDFPDQPLFNINTNDK